MGIVFVSFRVYWRSFLGLLVFSLNFILCRGWIWLFVRIELLLMVILMLVLFWWIMKIWCLKLVLKIGCNWFRVVLLVNGVLVRRLVFSLVLGSDYFYLLCWWVFVENLFLVFRVWINLLFCWCSCSVICCVFNVLFGVLKYWFWSVCVFSVLMLFWIDSQDVVCIRFVFVSVNFIFSLIVIMFLIIV